jgi:hypothetical protein
VWFFDLAILTDLASVLMVNLLPITITLHITPPEFRRQAITPIHTRGSSVMWHFA